MRYKRKYTKLVAVRVSISRLYTALQRDYPDVIEGISREDFNKSIYIFFRVLQYLDAFGVSMEGDNISWTSDRDPIRWLSFIQSCHSIVHVPDQHTAKGQWCYQKSWPRVRDMKAKNQIESVHFRTGKAQVALSIFWKNVWRRYVKLRNSKKKK